MIKILHIDDEPEMLQLTNSMLTKLDSNLLIESTSNVKNGLDLILSNSFDIILVDYNLSCALNGLDIFIFINDSIRWEKVPFILFTSVIQDELKMKLLNHGISYVLEKKGNPDEVYSKLHKSILRFLKYRLEVNKYSTIPDKQSRI